jgi:hypothetical protein
MDDRRARGRLLRLYLDDHASLLTVERGLVRRMIGSGAHEDGALLAGLRAEIEEDGARVVQLGRRIGWSPSRLKTGAAWTAERVARLKTNGRLVRRSPLSTLLELEGLGLLLAARGNLWSALAEVAAGAHEREDCAARAERVAARRREVDAARLRAAPAALSDA